MKRVVLLLSLVCLASATGWAGQPITIGETLTLQSKTMGEERTIQVSTPPGYDLGGGSFAVLYMTDGNAHLTHTRGTVDFLSGNGLMPQVIIVTVGNTDRTRDLTPTHVDRAQAEDGPPPVPTSGGASKFLDFFEDELIPYIDEHYRTVPMRLFAGHSFGGLFALNVAFTRPELFDAVIAVSPSLDWDDDLPNRQAIEFFKNREAFSGDLFVTMGNEEEGDPRPNRLDRFEETLEASSAEGFRWQIKRMPDETHGSVVLRSHYWGLRFIYEAWRLPRDPETGLVEGGLAVVIEHYSALSKRYGFEVTPDEIQINALGYQMLFQDDLDGAVEVFNYNTILYPESANVWDSLGEAYENAGKMKQAFESYSKAVENAAKNGDERIGVFTTNRDRAQGNIEKKKSQTERTKGLEK